MHIYCYTHIHYNKIYVHIYSTNIMQDQNNEALMLKSAQVAHFHHLRSPLGSARS